ncbi:metaxin-2 isoform X4 [Lingula anatina]|uniref:Metaxin-2 isoform X4 n=1 Tax=Lingula anatina TaxID=7574 RepID=A0A1S3J1U2_LINAN|nr:metaxin-2 isoform X4 [Lingula anatina]|eukprot:XP_013404231.1 metaxin-2 isoform X4 [Lingula anatina]
MTTLKEMVASAMTVELGAKEPWPDNVNLYQTYEAGQILLPDSASCLSVKAFLEMCGLKYSVVLRNNAEHMSPSGKVPFIQIGPFLISEFEPIIGFVNTKGFHLSANLDDTERAEMRAYMALVDNILVNAEHYISWCDATVLQTVTKPRYGSPYPWPLNKLVPLKKWYEETSRLKALGWSQKTLSEVCEEVQTCCQALSERLDKNNFFFGNRPTELDALVFGHLFTILTTPMPVNKLAEIVKNFDNLVHFCARIEQQYFSATEAS